MCSSSRRTNARDQGLTIVELVIVVAVMLVILGGILGMLAVAFRTQSGQSARSVALDELRGAVARMTKEVRQALSIAQPPTSDADTLDMQTLLNGVQHRIVYDVSGTSLRRTVDGGTPSVMTTSLSSTTLFAYSPATWTTAPAVVTITLRVQPQQTGAEPVTVTRDVQLRNSTG